MSYFQLVALEAAGAVGYIATSGVALLHGLMRAGNNTPPLSGKAITLLAAYIGGFALAVLYADWAVTSSALFNAGLAYVATVLASAAAGLLIVPLVGRLLVPFFKWFLASVWPSATVLALFALALVANTIQVNGFAPVAQMCTWAMP